VGRKEADQGPDLQTGGYKPVQTVFFADLAGLEPDRFAQQMQSIKPQFVVEALARDHIEWSTYILKKHRWVNRAFVLTAVAFGFLLLVGVSYLIRLSLNST